MFDTCDPVLSRFLCLEWRHAGDAGNLRTIVLAESVGNPTGRRGPGKGRARQVRVRVRFCDRS